MEEKKIYKIDLGQIMLKDFQEKLNPAFDWVQWGIKNDFPDALLLMLYNSSTHYNIVTKRKDMIVGAGVNIQRSTNKNQILTDKFINNINRYGENMDELIEKIAFDFVTFGQAAIQVIWGRGGKQIAEILHLPVNNLRYEKKDENGNINRYFYSENWKKWKLTQYAPIELTPFTTVPEIIAVAPTQVLLIRPYSPGCGYYTQPTYVGGLNYINLDWQMSEFAQATIKNGCFPSVMITMKNVPDDEKDFVVQSFEQQYTSAQNSHKVLFNFVENADDLTITPITTDGQESMIETLNNLATTNILRSHGCPGILIGIAEAGKLGETAEINNAFLQFEATVIQPDRNIILSKINKLLKINGLDEIQISSSAPIPFQGSEQVMMSVLTANELREFLGFKQLTEGEYKDIVLVVIYNSKAKVAGETPAATVAPKDNKQIIK